MFYEPIFFERNRVRRVYTGGKLFGDFFGDAAVDGFLPEEWVASAVEACNKESDREKEGVSVVRGSGVHFDGLLEKYPQEMLGSRGKMRILVKLLDSAVRLPAQAHPDKAFSRKYFQSEYGKTESWIILDTRPGAKIYFGFRDGVTREMFLSAIEASKTDKDAMERLMECWEPRIGDVFLVPAKTVHAIGAGCLILEVQEPTDFTIQPEYRCDEYLLSHREMYMSLSKEEAMGCFSFAKAPDAKIAPRILRDSEGVKVEALIGEGDTDCFVINRVTLTGGAYGINVPDSYGVYVATAGWGELTGGNNAREIRKGDYFFMPACLMGKYSVKGWLELVECY